MAVPGNLTTFKGLQFGIDPRRVTEPYVVDGENFYVGIDGPVSGFGAEQVSSGRLANPVNTQSFLVENTVFYFSGASVFVYDVATMTYTPLYTFTVTGSTVTPWSVATVGGYYYFAREGVGLLQHNPITGAWTLLNGGAIPLNVAGVSRSRGRLLVITDKYSAWSAIDDGTDFTASTITGAAAQALVIVGHGNGRVIKETADGFVSYTDSGILRSQAVNTVNPYRHEPVSDTTKTVQTAINPFCVVELANKQQIVLTRTGLYSVVGADIQPWQPLVGEYLRTYVLQTLDFTIDAVIRLTYLPEKQWFFISYSESEKSAIYTKALCLYVPTGEWGSFDAVHTAFVHVPQTAAGLDSFAWGYLTPAGHLFKFKENPFTTVEVASAGRLVEYAKTAEFTASERDGVYTFDDHARSLDIVDANFNVAGTWDSVGVLESASVDDEPQPAVDTISAESGGEYIFTTNAIAQNSFNVAGAVRISAEQVGLDSFIKVGPLRVQPQTEAVRLFMINNIAVGMPATAFIETYADWLLAGEDEDWMLDGSDEDWLALSGEAVDYTFTLEPTIDGDTAYGLDLQAPIETLNSNRTRHFAAGHEGVYHFMRFAATEPNQAFALKQVAVDGIFTGVL